jgi:hypothetical protein
MTVDLLLTDAFRELGLPKQAKEITYQDRAFALRKLNGIIDGYRTQGGMSINEDAYSFSLTSGKYTYSVGTTGTDFIVDQLPLQADRIFIIDQLANPQQVAYSVRVLSVLDYQDQRPNTAVRGIPQIASIAHAADHATLTLYPTPDRTYSIQLFAKHQLPEFTTLNDTVTIPPGLRKLILLQLAIELSSAYEVTPSAVTVSSYQDALYHYKKEQSADTALLP